MYYYFWCIIEFGLSQMYDRALSAPSSPTKADPSGRRSWEEPSWMGSSPRTLNRDMKQNVSRSLQTLPTSSSSFKPGNESLVPCRHNILCFWMQRPWDNMCFSIPFLIYIWFSLIWIHLFYLFLSLGHHGHGLSLVCPILTCMLIVYQACA